MNYNKEIIDTICDMKSNGFSHRDISEKVFGKRTSASVVWYILNHYYYTSPFSEVKKAPKILLMDIETSPELGYHWGRWKQNVGVKQVKRRSNLLTFAYKWLGSTETYADALPYYPDYMLDMHDDALLVKAMWNLLDSADAVVAHNGDKFDLAYLNSRFAYHGLGMPSPYKSIDTLKIAKKYFRFPANSLAELCAYFNVAGKFDTNFDLWLGCERGDPASWEEMVTYNIQDVKALEDVYMKLAPYDKGHPNLGLYYDDDAIRDPVTGSTDVVELKGNAYTAMSGFKSYRGPTGHVFRTNKKVKKVITANAQ